MLNAEALEAQKEREVQLIAANQKISAAEELHLSTARDTKERADATFLSQMQAEVRHRAATHPHPHPHPGQVSHRAASKAEADATGAALAETIAGERASEKLDQDAKQAACLGLGLGLG